MMETLLGKQIIELDLDATSNYDAIKKISKQLVDNGLAKNSFQEAILNREMNFPTGLDTGSYGVAIPHTDSVHVVEDQIAFARLKNPVVFKQMGDGTNVNVKFVFILALKEAHSQLSMLQTLMNLFQNSTAMTLLLKAENIQQVIDVLSKEGIN
ncbi:PTS sugar transporter subunit IIA [Oenococcus sicerae]|nr:PTS sugar transporter subunit IIA [Oenococcus sicerae]